MENVTDRLSNPFGLDPPCERVVHGYGDANAHFHVVGDHPGVHGGADSGVPFTDCEAGRRLQRVLAAVGLLGATGTPPEVAGTYLSYLHCCVPDGEPTDADYDALEPFFDAELRAIVAHVLLPVGARAIAHVLTEFTAREVPADPESLHATELLGRGFLVVPIREPTDWEDDDETALVECLRALQATDYRREVDLGRFLAEDDPYYVR